MALVIRVILGLSFALSATAVMGQKWNPRTWVKQPPMSARPSTLPRTGLPSPSEFRMPQFQMPQLSMPQFEMPNTQMSRWQLPQVHKRNAQETNSPVQTVGFIQKWNDSMGQTLEKTKRALTLPAATRENPSSAQSVSSRSMLPGWLKPNRQSPRQPATLKEFLGQPRPQ